MNNGFIKLHRKILDNPIIMKDSEHLALWTYLLLEATHKNLDRLFKGERITLKAGQLITGRTVISKVLNINSSKVQRILDDFEREKQIEQQTSNKNRLISILKWDEYQSSEQQVNSTFSQNYFTGFEKHPKNEQQLNNWEQDISMGIEDCTNKSEQQLNNKRTTTEQQANTLQEYKECKNIKKEKKNNIYTLVQEFENLWSIYPKKQGKTDAEKKYQKYRKEGTTYEEVLQGLENYNSYIKRKGIEQRYIKNGSTWFNQKCWNDDYTDTETRDPQMEILRGVYNGEIKIN